MIASLSLPGSAPMLINEVITTRIVAIDKDGSLTVAKDIFISRRYSCTPIIDDRKIPIGIVSWHGVLRGLQDSAAA
ncbi:MAG: CBS domain-containing protein [Granulosicoccus sp.]